MKTSNLVALIVSIFSLTACGAGVVEDGAADTADGSAALSNKGRFETFAGVDGRFYFHLLAANGEKVLASQGYASATGAANGVASVKANGTSAANYQMRTAADGSPYFVLLAGNGAVIGVSELYASQSNADRALNTVVSIVSATAATPLAPITGARFDVFQGLDGKYYFDLRAANGEIVLQSQGYTTKTSAVAGTASVQANGTLAARYQVRAAADGETYFVLRAGNNKVIGVSQMYSTSSDAQQGISAVESVLAAGK